MSRSRKHNPIGGCGKGSEKKDKQMANQRLRQKERQTLKTLQFQITDANGNIISLQEADETIFPVIDDVSNIYDFTKDGKMRVEKDSPWYQKMMRK